MRFAWDQRKNEANLLRRRLDFEFAVLIFSGQTLEREDTRRDYGERRVIAQGLANELCLTVVYTDRRDPAGGLERRIISARRSNREERRRYAKAYPKTTDSGPSGPRLPEEHER
jgi:uncharacterized DUF497 family protein